LLLLLVALHNNHIYVTHAAIFIVIGTVEVRGFEKLGIFLIN
jgi:hypothetical protein